MMKKLILAALIMISLFPSVCLSESYENAMIIPLEFFDRIVVYDNKNGSWEHDAFRICSAYFDNLDKNSFRAYSYEITFYKTSIGNHYYELFRVYVPDEDIEDHQHITAWSCDAKAISSSDSLVFLDTVKYYTDQLGSGQYFITPSESGNTILYQIKNESRNICVEIAYRDVNTIDFLTLHIFKLSELDNF